MSAEQVNTPWEPGIPLYQHGSYTNYVFNFRDDHVGDEPNADAASWPEPRRNQALNHRDELGEFIERYHAWRATEERE